MEIAHLEGFQRAGKRKARFANRWRHISKILYTYIIELPQLVGGSVMTFLLISNPLAAKHKKHIWPLGGATWLIGYRI